MLGPVPDFPRGGAVVSSFSPPWLMRMQLALPDRLRLLLNLEPVVRRLLTYLAMKRRAPGRQATMTPTVISMYDQVTVAKTSPKRGN